MRTPAKNPKFSFYNDMHSPGRNSPSRIDIGYTPDREAHKARINATKKKRKKRPKKKLTPVKVKHVR